jgi:hypothetical protein
MYSAVSIGDTVVRFMNANAFDQNGADVMDDRAFGAFIVKIGDHLEGRLRRLGWKTLAAAECEEESLAAVSIRCLRSLGQAFQHARDDSILHKQAFFTLLAALTSIIEDAERGPNDAPHPVRVRRFLSSPIEIPDPNWPLEIGEEIGAY